MVTKEILAEQLLTAMNSVSDVEIDPAEGRKKIADAIAGAINDFVVGRTTVVTGTSATGGPVTGTGVIQ